MPPSPSDFYTGLVAELYTPLKSTSFDADRYVRLLREHGEPALELGCGDGDPLLDLLAAGHDVDGIDSSADMIARLHERAAARDIRATARVARMEDLTVARRYRTVFLAGPTFNLLPDDDAMGAALHAVAGALDDGGTAVVPLFVPGAVQVPAAGEEPPRTPLPTGWMSWQVLDSRRDERTRTQLTTLRYERLHEGVRERLDRDWLLHWIGLDRFARLAADAGLRVVEAPDELDGDPRDVVLRPAGRST